MTLRGRATRTVVGMGPPAQDRVGVLAVDDQSIFLDVARDVVAATPGFSWVGGATCAEEALDAVRELGPELVLMEIDESPAITPAIEASGAAALVRKQEFSPAMLRRLWLTYGKSDN